MPLLSAETFSKLRKSRSFWALADQGVVSAGTFFTNIMLMRTWDKDTFGVYGLLLSILVLMNNLHQSIITYPLSVRGAKAGDGELRTMTGQFLLLTTLLSVPLMLGIMGAAIALHSWSLAPWVGLAMLAWQWQETTRRALISHLRTSEVVWGDAVSYLGQAVVVAVLCRNHQSPDLRTIFLTIAVTSALAALVQAMQLKLRNLSIDGCRELAGVAFKLGGWLLMTNALNLLTIQMITWTLYYSAGDGAGMVGIFAALSNVMGISHPIIFGISGLIVPGVAKARMEKGLAAARRYGFKMCALGLGIVMPYYFVLLAFPVFSLRMFSGKNSPYLAYGTELRWFVVQYIAVYLSYVTTAVLNGLERGRWTFFGQAGNAATSILVRIPLTWYHGLVAAIWTGALTYGSQTAVNLFGLLKSDPIDRGFEVVRPVAPAVGSPEIGLEV